MGPGESRGQHYQPNYGPGRFSGQQVEAPPQPWGTRLAPPGSWEPGASSTQASKRNGRVLCEDAAAARPQQSVGKASVWLMAAAFRVPGAGSFPLLICVWFLFAQSLNLCSLSLLFFERCCINMRVFQIRLWRFKAAKTQPGCNGEQTGSFVFPGQIPGERVVH